MVAGGGGGFFAFLLIGGGQFFSDSAELSLTETNSVFGFKKIALPWKLALVFFLDRTRLGVFALKKKNAIATRMKNINTDRMASQQSASSRSTDRCGKPRRIDCCFCGIFEMVFKVDRLLSLCFFASAALRTTNALG